MNQFIQITEKQAVNRDHIVMIEKNGAKTNLTLSIYLPNDKPSVTWTITVD